MTISPSGSGITLVPSSGGGGTIESTTDILSGDGAGDAVSSGITAANVVTAAANITDTALLKGSGGAKGTATTGILVDGSNNVSGVGTLASGTHTITSTSAAALTVGANGATNPVLTAHASATSVVTGVEVRGAASGAGAFITATSSASAEALTVSSKSTGALTLIGGGNINLQAGSFTAVNMTVGGNQVAAFSSFRHVYTITGTTNNASDTRFLFNGSNDSGASLTASTEAIMWNASFSASRNHATGDYALQRDVVFTPNTHTFTGSSTITLAAGFSLTGAPIAGNNAIFTSTSTLYSSGRAVTTGSGSVTNSYGLNITANTGATNNYAFSFSGSAGELATLRTDGKLSLLATNTAAGTTGAQTINKPSGTVNFAAAATSLTVTNSLCTTSSIVFAVVRTNDTTATIKNVVPGAGSFVINLGAAATAETSVGFFIIN